MMEQNILCTASMETFRKSVLPGFDAANEPSYNNVYVPGQRLELRRRRQPAV